jgi:drug/metabolite transporter (DMT)-like permease
MKIIVAFILLLSVNSIQAQNKLKVKDRQYYHEKGKRQQIIGCFLLGAGTAMIVGGYLQFERASLWNNGWAVPLTVLFTGIPVAVSSLPFLIYGAKNKRIAKGMTGIKFNSSHLADINRPIFYPGFYLNMDF